VIQLKNLCKKFGQQLAVDDLTLQVPAGEIYGLLGHNGAGKSTAIGMMLGQVWPTSGDVRICGHDVTAHRRLALQKVGAIFESPAFYDYLSGRRNLEILSSYTAPTSRKRIQEVIEWVGLTGREHSKVRTYSHGMRARLALAQALLPQPELLILDEPSDGLDPEGIHEMRQTIQRLHREGTLAATKQRAWTRLKAGDFGLAVKQLREAQLITEERDGHLIALGPGIGTDQVVRLLVERGMAVYEIAPVQDTLEDFYLSLMNGQRERA
jgi:ABC-2 type transport system ATP-binding protein